MSLVIAEFGAIMILAKQVTQKKEGGVYYFRRRVPEDLRKHYPSLSKRGELFKSLKTKNLKEAATRAHRLTTEDVFLDDPIPYVRVRPTEERSLKTDGSERSVPLVGAGLWAVKRA